MNAVANNPAIPKPQFVDSLRADLTWSQRPQAVDYIRPGAGDRLQNFARSLLQQLRRYDKETGVRPSRGKYVGRGHGHERLAGAHFGDDCPLNRKVTANWEHKVAGAGTELV